MLDLKGGGVHSSRRSRRLRRALRRAGYRGINFDALDESAAARPQPARPVSTPFVLAPGKTRYQRRSAGLPHGIVGFPGLGIEAPQFTIDLTAADAELADWTRA